MNNDYGGGVGEGAELHHAVRTGTEDEGLFVFDRFLKATENEVKVILVITYL